MPIGPVTPQVDGTPVNLTSMRLNINLVESYIQGNITAADFQDKVRGIHGLKNSVHRVYGEHFTANVEPNQGNSVADTALTVWSLDRDAVLDFTHYGDINADFYDSPTKQYIIGSSVAFRRFTWEKMGNVPTLLHNGAGKKIETDCWSWRNWLFNAPDPTVALGLGMVSYIDGRQPAKRFPEDEYWDRWLTVPYASKRIYIPGPCVLHVMGNAVGTWNHTLNGFFEFDEDGDPSAGSKWTVANGYSPANETPAFFRLFIDRDNNEEWREFSWSVGGQTFYANWSPVQEYPEVGYSTDAAYSKMLGREWSISCAPRAKAVITSQIAIPSAGWYNISMKYNSRYIHGISKNIGAGSWEWQKGFWLKQGTTAFRPGYITQARWESTGIGAIAVLNRTVPTDTYAHSDF